MVRDRGGDSLKASSKLRINSRPGKLRDFVSKPADPTDLFSFRLRNSSSVNVTLSKLQSNVNLELYTLKKPRRRTLKQIGGQEFNDLSRRQINRYLSKVAQSKQGGTQNEDITIDLEPGFYYVRVFARQRQGSRYRLRYQANPITDPPVQPDNPLTELPGPELPGPESPGSELPGSESPGSDSPPPTSGGGDMPAMPSEPIPVVDVSETTLYSGSGLPVAEGWLAPQQFPVSETEVDQFLDDLAASNPLLANLVDFDDLVQDAIADRQIAPPLTETVGAAGVTVDTRFFPSDDPNRGYFGYSNYQPVLPDVDELDLAGLAADLDNLYENLAQDITVEPVNQDFPTLDSTLGYSLEFDLALTEESSAANRAGFSLTVIGGDGRGIELGFKADRIFAQAADLTNASEAETVTPADFVLSDRVRYRLAVDGSGYRLFANDSQILNGTLRDYVFDPTQSDPALPINPYETENLIFLGDNTDQGFAKFTLGRVALFM